MKINKTMFVAHRGGKLSDYVENTKEAFIEGAKKGYEYLECDLRITKDNKFIIFHDENLCRLTKNSNVNYDYNVNNEDFDMIKDIELTELYRNKLKTNGKICLLEEYLEICRTFNVIPIIELKWTNKIYSHNDNQDVFCYDNIDLLIDYIKKYQLENRCYIMTSMRGCLDYIKNKYPFIRLQWLARSTILDHLDWAIANKIDLDCEKIYLTKEIVDIAHKNGLLVNVWTVNDLDDLSRFVDMGVDMVTTNVFIHKDLVK